MLADTQKFVLELTLALAANAVMAALWLERLRSGSGSAAVSNSNSCESDHTWTSESSDPVRMCVGVAVTQDTPWTWRAGVDTNRPVHV